MNPEDQNLETQPDQTPVDITAEAVAALDQGIAELEGGTPDPAPAEPVAPVAEGDPAPAAPDPIDTEIAQMGLKAKSAERFRALANEAAGYRTALEQAGFKDVAEVVALAKQAKDWEAAVQDTGASPEQYASSVSYLKLINSQDPRDLEAAYDILSTEMEALAKALGREVPGKYDPLSEHADLQDAVDNGDITRKHAMELVKARAGQKVVEQRTQQTKAQQEQQQAFDRAVNDLNTLGAQLQARDPLYAQKIEALKPTIALIRSKLPVTEWVAAVQQAYAQVVVPNVAPVAQRPQVGPVSARPTNPAPMQKVTNDPLEALDMGIALANQGGTYY